ncbi:plasmid mobilization protein [Streptomyces albicerus]|uniref:plasmid mobilization protein n=1 Tax=Streptomyces albicerus TaxID=2569859 RepID=UPI00124AF42A|nr:ribbon-helix-helix protein, CopG family [Streptomyces albicerus]
MARTRITISLERDQAERIRQHAERAGLDVSAYLVHAATRQMAETEAIEEQFSGVDALIAAAEAEAEAFTPEPDTTTPDLTEQERRDVEAALNLVYGEDRTTARPGQAA